MIFIDLEEQGLSILEIKKDWIILLKIVNLYQNWKIYLLLWVLTKLPKEFLNKPHKKVKIINELYIAVSIKKIPLNLNFKNIVIKKVFSSLILIWVIKIETMRRIMKDKSWENLFKIKILNKMIY